MQATNEIDRRQTELAEGRDNGEDGEQRGKPKRCGEMHAGSAANRKVVDERSVESESQGKEGRSA
eukprot:1156005-Rhodomonas_salina.1